MTDSDRRETLGETLRRARLDKDLGLRQLARTIKKTPSYLSDIENDRRVPAEDVLEDLAKELDLTFEQLMALAGRLGAQTQRYLRNQPGATTLFRRIPEKQLDADQLQRLLRSIEQLTKEPPPKG